MQLPCTGTLLIILACHTLCSNNNNDNDNNKETDKNTKAVIKLTKLAKERAKTEVAKRGVDGRATWYSAYRRCQSHGCD